MLQKGKAEIRSESASLVILLAETDEVGYRCGMDYLALFAAAVTLVVATAAIFAGFGLAKRLNALERPAKEKRDDEVAQAARDLSLETRLSAIEKRPEAPAMEQYRRVLEEIEGWAHKVRDMEMRFEEMAGSLKRQQASQASRSRRKVKAEELEPEEEEQLEDELPLTFLPQMQQPAMNGHAPPPPAGRRFGKLT